METKEYKTMDKTKWGDGPWQTEPDKRQWQDSETGMPCLIVRNNFGALCGYVGVSRDHPLFGLHFDQKHECLRKPWETLKEGEIGKRGTFALLFNSMDKENDLPRLDVFFNVHGSLSFAGGCMKPDPRYPQITPEIVESEGICHVDPGKDDVWWFGFDCGHCDDWSPKLYSEDLDKMGDNPFHAHYGKDMIYRDLDYVTAETASLAKQLKAIA